MASLSLSGLASGIDTDSLVTKLVAAAKTPITKVQTQQSVLQAKQTGINRLNTKLDSLEAVAVKLSDQAQVAQPKASSSDAAVVKVTADGSASQGTYDVRVAALAKAERSYSNSFAGRDTTGLFGAGTLRISVGGSDYDIAVTATDTLTTVSDKINQATGDVQASVFSDGNGFRLQVAGTKTGTDNAITFTETGVSLGLSDPGAEVISAQDAKVSVDGFVVTSQTNTISSALAGVSIELTGTTAGATYDSGTNSISGGTAASVNVARDAANLKDSITGFVTAYNDVVKELATQNGQSPDPTLLAVSSKLREALKSVVGGLPKDMESLSQIGLATNKDGTIRLDETTFNKKVSENFQGVVNLFASVGARKGIGEAFKKTISDMQADNGSRDQGLIKAKLTSIDKRLLVMADQIDAMNTRLDAYQARLKRQFTAMEQAITKLQGDSSYVTSVLSTNS